MKHFLLSTGLLITLLSSCEKAELESNAYLQNTLTIETKANEDVHVINGILNFPNYESYSKTFSALHKLSPDELLNWNKQLSFSSMYSNEMKKRNYIEVNDEEKIENDGELDEIRKSLYSDKGLLIIGDTIYKVKGEYIYKVPTSSESILSEIDETPEKFKDIRFRHTIQMTASISETHNTPRIVYEDAVIQGGGEARTPLFKVNSKRREHIKFIAEIQVDNKWCYLKFGLRGRAQKKKIGILEKLY